MGGRRPHHLRIGLPHWDHSYPKSVKELADRADLTDAQKRKILADNARRFYTLA